MTDKEVERLSPYKMAKQFEIAPQILYYGLSRDLIEDVTYNDEGRPLVTRAAVTKYLERDKYHDGLATRKVHDNSLQARNARLREKMKKMLHELEASKTSVPNRSFGVELELSAKGSIKTQEDAVAIIRGMGLPVKAAGPTNRSYDMWLAKPDATCAVELTTPKLKGEAGLLQLIKVVQVLNKEGAEVDVKCALHIHWDASDFVSDISKAVRLLLLYMFNESVIDQMFPQSRKDNTYARSLKHLNIPEITRAQDVGYLRQMMQWTDTYEGIERTLSRMWKVNIDPLDKIGSVEFRQASGTLDVEKIVNWIAFTGAMVEFAAGDAMIKKVNNFRAMAHTIALPKPVGDWWIGRIEELKGGDA